MLAPILAVGLGQELLYSKFKANLLMNTLAKFSPGTHVRCLFFSPTHDGCFDLARPQRRLIQPSQPPSLANTF